MTITNTKDANWYLPAPNIETEITTPDTEVYVLDKTSEQTSFQYYNWRCSDSSDQSVNGWLSLVREKLYSNPSVEDIFVSIEDSNVDVWVVIPERDLAILHQIVEIEGRILETLVSGERPAFLIDFHIIYRCGRNIKDFAPTRAIELPRQVQQKNA